MTNITQPIKTHRYRKQHDEHVKLYGEQMVERTNLITGKKFWEKRNTPVYCSPACESYWSM